MTQSLFWKHYSASLSLSFFPSLSFALFLISSLLSFFPFFSSLLFFFSYSFSLPLSCSLVFPPGTCCVCRWFLQVTKGEWCWERGCVDRQTPPWKLGQMLKREGDWCPACWGCHAAATTQTGWSILHLRYRCKNQDSWANFLMEEGF